MRNWFFHIPGIEARNNIAINVQCCNIAEMICIKRDWIINRVYGRGGGEEFNFIDLKIILLSYQNNYAQSWLLEYQSFFATLFIYAWVSYIIILIIKQNYFHNFIYVYSYFFGYSKSYFCKQLKMKEVKYV